jgi:hypothetical protein
MGSMGTDLDAEVDELTQRSVDACHDEAIARLSTGSDSHRRRPQLRQESTSYESQRQPQPVKPDRVVHHLTPAGRAELHRWLSEPSPRLRGYRDDFFLKLMAAVQAGDRKR